MSERLPRAARSINAVKSSGDLIEKTLRLFGAGGENALQINLVAGMFREFLRAADGKLDEFTRRALGILVQLVKRPFAVAPRLDERAVGEQAEMRGNARLAEPGDFLKFVHGQFVPLQQGDNAQAGRVGQRP